MVVQELGWDNDADDDVRISIEDAIDGEMVEEAMEAVDLVLLWWRDEDGDLVDGLLSALTDLNEFGLHLADDPQGRPGGGCAGAGGGVCAWINEGDSALIAAIRCRHERNIVLTPKWMCCR